MISVSVQTLPSYIFVNTAEIQTEAQLGVDMQASHSSLRSVNIQLESALKDGIYVW